MVIYAAYIISFLVIYLFLPVYLSVHSGYFSVKALAVFYSACGVIIIFLGNAHRKRMNRIGLDLQSEEEKSNVLRDENSRELNEQAALQEKIKKYHSLKSIIEQMNQNLSLDAIAEQLIASVYSLIAANHKTSILYLIDPMTHALTLYKTKKENQGLVIKAKEGDIFDQWVLRHNSPLFMEDIKNDFRFDPAKITPQERQVVSLIAAPLMSGHKCVGVLRLDSPVARSFTQDDLRFFVTLSEMGAIAIENGELFLRTQDLAIHDGLTGLYRKGYFLERLREECRRSLRQQKTFALFMLDIDFFKVYNDTYGHIAGDIILKEISAVFSQFLSDKSALIGRFGGEEFCVVLFHSDVKQAAFVAEGLRKAIEATAISLRNKTIHATVSVGVANFPEHATDETELIMKADKALYEAKHKGRNRVVVA